MFWRKKEAKAKEQTVKEDAMSESAKLKAEIEQTPRSKLKSERAQWMAEWEELVNRIVKEIEQLTPGQVLMYKLPEFFWSGFAAFLIVEVNPGYPEKDKKKYIGYADKMVEGKPAGQKLNIWKSDKPKDLAEWIAQRNKYGSIERFQE